MYSAAQPGLCIGSRILGNFGKFSLGFQGFVPEQVTKMIIQGRSVIRVLIDHPTGLKTELPHLQQPAAPRFGPQTRWVSQGPQRGDVRCKSLARTRDAHGPPRSKCRRVCFWVRGGPPRRTPLGALRLRR